MNTSATQAEAETSDKVLTQAEYFDQIVPRIQPNNGFLRAQRVPVLPGDYVNLCPNRIHQLLSNQ